MLADKIVDYYQQHRALDVFAALDFTPLDNEFKFTDYTTAEIDSTRNIKSEFFKSHASQILVFGIALMIFPLLLAFALQLLSSTWLITEVVMFIVGFIMIMIYVNTKPDVSELRSMHFTDANPDALIFGGLHEQLNLAYAASHFMVNGYHIKWSNTLVYQGGDYEAGNYSYDTQHTTTDSKGNTQTTYETHLLPYAVIRTPFTLPAVKFVRKGFFKGTDSPLQRNIYPQKFAIKAGFDDKYHTFIQPGTEQLVLQVFTDDILAKIYDLDIHVEIQAIDNQLYFFVHDKFGYNLDSKKAGKRFAWLAQVMVELIDIHTEILENMDARLKLTTEQQQNFAKLRAQILNR
ncbi:MAG: hypothetical protein LBT80_07085 [Lactobacillaceae bacterium]|jgi:hypothetical protein|nr:hypothetical protein [Lactobacillaceae bacterium]